jgi:adenylate kinase
MKVLRCIFVGPPGSGKGTQAELLKSKYSVAHISTGEVFRKEVDQETELGLKIKDTLKKGDLVTDSIVDEVIKANLPSNKSFILDGYPRNVHQANFLNDILKAKGEALSHICFFKIDDEILLERIKSRAEVSRRTDDTVATAKSRIEIYRKYEALLLEYYQKSSLVCVIEASSSVEVIHETLVETFEGFF